MRVTRLSEDRPLLAIAMVLGAMLVFVSTDAIAKHLSVTLSAQQIVWVRYTVITLLSASLIARSPGGLRTNHYVLHILRGLSLLGASLLFVFALKDLPLELCTAIGFAAPLYVTALSIPLLREKVGVRRWAAVAIGFLGVMVIVRPGSASFNWAMVYPLASSLCWACGLIITRLMRGTERPMVVLFYSSVVGCVASAPMALPFWQPPNGFEWLLLISLGALNAIGQYLIIHAFMLASASMLAPFSYSSIVWATLIGAVFFGSLPDQPTVAGTALLIAAGLYVWHRERVRAGVAP